MSFPEGFILRSHARIMTANVASAKWLRSFEALMSRLRDTYGAATDKTRGKRAVWVSTCLDSAKVWLRKLNVWDGLERVRICEAFRPRIVNQPKNLKILIINQPIAIEFVSILYNQALSILNTEVNKILSYFMFGPCELTWSECFVTALSLKASLGQGPLEHARPYFIELAFIFSQWMPVRLFILIATHHAHKICIFEDCITRKPYTSTRMSKYVGAGEIDFNDRWRGYLNKRLACYRRLIIRDAGMIICKFYGIFKIRFWQIA